MVLGQMLLQVVKIMNRLLVVEDKKITSGEYNLELNENVVINIEGNVILHDINNINKEFNIELEDNSNLDLYLIKKSECDYNISFSLLNNVKLNLNMLILNNNKNKVTVNINMLGNSSKAILDIRGMNIDNDSNLDIICNGYVKKNTKDNELIENLKGLIKNENDTIKISPVMKIDTNEVSANHLVTIGSFNKEELFYLESLGLDKDNAQNMLTNSFLKHNMRNIELEFLNLGGDIFE